MIYVSIVLFGTAAVLGLTILLRWLSKKEGHKIVIYSHGTLAGVSLVLLISFTIMHPDHFPKIPLLLFSLAALVGFYMFFMNQVRNTRPVSVAIVHGLVAVSAFVLLLMFIL